MSIRPVISRLGSGECPASSLWIAISSGLPVGSNLPNQDLAEDSVRRGTRRSCRRIATARECDLTIGDGVVGNRYSRPIAVISFPRIEAERTELVRSHAHDVPPMRIQWIRGVHDAKRFQSPVSGQKLEGTLSS